MLHHTLPLLLPVPLQLQEAGSRAAAADQRRQLYRLTSAHVGRDAPETCAICCEAISPLQATQGEEQQLLLLGCAHCFHYKCAGTGGGEGGWWWPGQRGPGSYCVCVVAAAVVVVVVGVSGSGGDCWLG